MTRPDPRLKHYLPGLLELGCEVFIHSPYSPDLAPSNYYMCLSLSGALLYKTFCNKTDLNQWLEEFFSSKPISIYPDGNKILPETWPKVTGCAGDYFYLIKLFSLIKILGFMHHSWNCKTIRFELKFNPLPVQRHRLYIYLHTINPFCVGKHLELYPLYSTTYYIFPPINYSPSFRWIHKSPDSVSARALPST